MCAPPKQKLILVVIVLNHFITFCIVTGSSRGGCGFGTSRREIRGILLDTIDYPPPCNDVVTCRSKLNDCLLPQFQCLSDGKCIPRSQHCDGITDCDYGTDEWGCSYTSSGSTTTSTMLSVSVKNTFSYTRVTSTMLRDNEATTTPSSFTTDTSDTIFQEYEANTVPSSTATSVIFPESKSSSSSTKTGNLLPYFEENTTFSSFAAGNTLLPGYESSTSSPNTDNSKLPEYEENASSLTTNTMVSEYEEKISSPVTDNRMLPESSEKQLCPDKYCMQNAECVIIGGQYHCNCPSYIGEHCEIQQGFNLGSHENIVAIVICMSLVVLCSTVLTVCIYRYKRLSAWKSNDTTYRTLSQLTLTRDMEEPSVSVPHY